MYSNGYTAYKTNSVNYASKDQLLLMLVDGAVKFAKIARQAIIDKNVKKAHENITKTEDIFTELRASLDTSAGEWAQNMFDVYGFINEKLFEANLKKDEKIMNEVIPLIEEIRDIWHEADKRSKRV
ncbi:flagellar export chaperone FliS [Clostridium botulinum]|uniref:flagellar export chaperone FliS n=1 Tax=Clostridium botulinum TaxID=1491 RepID=UPI000A1733D1|nr:flagellar export chaperone FliS [Clostridium botulinum]MBN1041171.1 flagellar export chaperone FliS [Clostridium botulinum]MBN1047809.1 flagellar export chaperone FliS [Clostridium botulinum]NFO11818.1 flagellar export chaperone FliS [Clostridium botulinum]NFO29862.1 flagellar export chaperone FliS [Clostridium botulinum]NFO52632.1 flagellar export chaperone FliS [Clostridium botulinum]